MQEPIQPGTTAAAHAVPGAATTRPPLPPAAPAVPVESGRSAVSWGAVFAGAVIAAAVSAMLMFAGTGLGFLSMSPWRGDGVSASTLAWGTIIWMLLTHIITYAIAGYVTGRLRTRWTDTMLDEVYFRDTAHGFLVWALSMVISIALMGSLLISALSGAASAGSTVLGAGVAGAAAGTAQATEQDDNLVFQGYTDVLLRPAQGSPAAGSRDPGPEVTRLLARSLVRGEITPADRTYLISVIEQQAGVDAAEAERRLQTVEQQAREAEIEVREAADTARKLAATFALWAFASMLIGAFVCSLAATYGGRARDL